MLCGSCRREDADFYTKITNGQKIFDILTKINPTIVYKHYFCEACVALATKKLDDEAAAIMNDQNAHGLSVGNPSFTTSSSNSSKVSSDKEAGHIASPVKKSFKPCPKRFKQQLAWIVLASNPASEYKREPATVATSSDDSESLSENEILLDVKSGSGEHPERSNSDQSVVGVSFVHIGSIEGLVPIKEEHHTIVVDLTGSVEGSVVQEQQSIAVDDINTSVEGSLAPVARNPRIREASVHVTGNVQTYFREGQVAINVNNYSRSIAG